MDSSEPKLSERDLAVLVFEGSWWQANAPKDQAVRERFQLTEAEYVVVLDEVISRDEALEVDPLLVRRLRRQRDRRRRAHLDRRTADQEVVR